MRAYILLEGLLALMLLSVITSIILFEIDSGRKRQSQLLTELETLNVARMAWQTGLDQLELNGVSVQIKRGEDSVTIISDSKEVLSVKLEEKDARLHPD